MLILRDQLHWLDVPERVECKLAVMVRRCLEDKPPKYLSVNCTPVTAVNSRHLRSANQHQLTVPRCRRITFGRRAFSVGGSRVWNSLPSFVVCLSVLATLGAPLRQYCSRNISAFSAVEMRSHNIALYKFPIPFYSILLCSVPSYITCISNLNGQLGQLCLQHRLLLVSHCSVCLSC